LIQGAEVGRPVRVRRDLRAQREALAAKGQALIQEAKALGTSLDRAKRSTQGVWGLIGYGPLRRLGNGEGLMAIPAQVDLSQQRVHALDGVGLETGGTGHPESDVAVHSRGSLALSRPQGNPVHTDEFQQQRQDTMTSFNNNILP
jgi:hypothetical protein